MRVSAYEVRVAWFKARDEAFAAGRQYTPTAFAPKGSIHHKPHGYTYPAVRA